MTLVLPCFCPCQLQRMSVMPCVCCLGMLKTLVLPCICLHCLSQQQCVTSRPALQVQWKNSTPDQNSWYGRDKLEEMGFTKLVNDIDAKEAARLGLVTRPLTEAVVQKHLEDLGLEAAFGTHSQMRGLSGAARCAGLQLCLMCCMVQLCMVGWHLRAAVWRCMQLCADWHRWM